MKISLRGLIIGNLFCLLTHLIFGIYRESPSGDGYLHGGITIQFIGDRLPYSRFELIILDLLVFYTIGFHSLIGVIDDSEVLQVTPIQHGNGNNDASMVEEQLDGTFGLDRVHIEEDGYNGNVYLLTIDILGNIKKCLIIKSIYNHHQEGDQIWKQIKHKCLVHSLVQVFPYKNVNL